MLMKKLNMSMFIVREQNNTRHISIYVINKFYAT